MIEEPPLVTIRENNFRPSSAQLEALSHYPTGFLVDAMDGVGALGYEIKPIGLPELPVQFCGPVLSCDCGPADILALLAAVAEARAGDVLVMATGNWRACAAVGDRVIGMAKNAGVAGFVTDGLVRDVAGIKSVGLPVFCAGVSPNSPVAKGPGTVGEPVVISGVVVASGDVIVGDEDGVVVVPQGKLDTVIDRLVEIEKLEQELDAKVAEGLVVMPSIEELLKSDQVRRIR